MKIFGLNFEPIVTVGEHKIELPIPTSRNEILFIDDKDASWNLVDKHGKIYATKRIIYPDIWYGYMPYDSTKVPATERFTEGSSSDTQATIWDKKNGALKSLSKEDTKIIDEIYNTELRRMTKGVHFRNGDDIEYLTPAHYTTLQWCRMSGLFKNNSYGFFYKFQRNVFYLLDHQWTIEWCTGIYFSKAKKIGITQVIGGGYFVWASITHFQWVLCMMSRSQPVANGTCYAYFLHAFNGLPKALMPKVAFLSPKGGDITFGERSRANIAAQEENVLNTRTMTVPTMEHAFDSFFPMLVWCDEFPKYWADAKKEPKKILDENINSIKDQLSVRGRFLISSYPPETNDIGAIQGKAVFYDSKLNGKETTKSGFICYHVPGNTSVKEFQDKYGNPLKNKADELIDAELKKVEKNKDKYLATLRVFARNEREAFDSGVSSIFDPVRLSELIYDLDELLRTGKIFEQGELQWDNPMWEVGRKDKRPKGTFGKVNFVPLHRDEIEKGQEAKMIMYEPMPTSYQNLALLQSKDEWGNLLPPPKFKNVGGIDPTDFRDTGNAEDGSYDAMYVMPVHDEIMNIANRRPVTKVITAEYLFRPDNPEEFYQDVVKFIIYFGCLVIVEANNGWLATRLEDEGLGHYMLFKNEDGILSFYKANHDKSLKHVRTLKSGNTDTVADLILLIKNYLQRANTDFNEIDYGKLIMSMRLLMQIKDFNPEDTKRFDTFIAFGYTLMCHEAYLALSNAPEDERYQASKMMAVANALFNRF